MAAAASQYHLVQIATDYVNYIDGLFSEFGYTIIGPIEYEGLYYFVLLHKKTHNETYNETHNETHNESIMNYIQRKDYVGLIAIAPFLKYRGENMTGSLKRYSRESTITNILHIHSLFIDRPEYQHMGLGTILILYSICKCYIINQDFRYVTTHDDTASNKHIGLDKKNIYLKLGFFPLLNLVEFQNKGKKFTIELQGKNSALRDPGLIADSSYLIGLTVPRMQQEPKQKTLHAKLTERQAQMKTEIAQMNANMNAGTRKTRRYRKKQRKTRRYRR